MLDKLVESIMDQVVGLTLDRYAVVEIRDNNFQELYEEIVERDIDITPVKFDMGRITYFSTINGIDIIFRVDGESYGNAIKVVTSISKHRILINN